MLIGEVASKTGLSRDTIRFYEKQGLIKLGRQERRDNGYKEYSESTLQRLNSIKLMKGFGFTLNEVAELLDLMDVNLATCSNVADMAKGKVALLEQKIRELEHVKNMLQEGLGKCKDGSCNPKQSEQNCTAIASGEMQTTS